MKCRLSLLMALNALLLSSHLTASPILSTNAKASSLGNAVTAEAIGIDSTSFNPATLTQLSMGPKGISREYKLIVLPFPDYKISSTKPSAEDDPFNDVNLFVNDCKGDCLLGEDDPRNTPWEPEIERLAMYVPGYGEIDIDSDLLNLIIAPLGGTAFRPSWNRKFVFASSVFIPMAGGIHLKEEAWNIKPATLSVGGFGVAPSFAFRLSSCIKSDW